MQISLTVNGERHRVDVEPRRTLADALREDLGLTGTHLGCEHGVCGACTIVVDGRPVRACLMFAVQADGASIATVEGLAADDGTLHPLQEAFSRCHGLQCGACTPGMLMTAAAPARHRTRAQPRAASAPRWPATSAAAPATSASSTPWSRRPPSSASSPPRPDGGPDGVRRHGPGRGAGVGPAPRSRVRSVGAAPGSGRGLAARRRAGRRCSGRRPHRGRGRRRRRHPRAARRGRRARRGPSAGPRRRPG